MTNRLNAQTLKAMITDGEEIALLDVREDGQFGEGHLLFTVPAPYSVLEIRLGAIMARKSTRTVLVDDGDGVAEKAAARMAELGFTDVSILEGGVPAWADAGYEIFKGVNVPCKAFGEVVEHAVHTPSISAEELNAMFEKNEDLVVVDGRTPAEYKRMSIPNGISVPNAELVYRIQELAPSPDTTVVVNCAGRTRSIIGAQTLINAKIPNKVVALRAGTMGWNLAGFELDHGATRRYPEVSDEGMKVARTARGGHGRALQHQEDRSRDGRQMAPRYRPQPPSARRVRPSRIRSGASARRSACAGRAAGASDGCVDRHQRRPRRADRRHRNPRDHRRALARADGLGCVRPRRRYRRRRHRKPACRRRNVLGLDDIDVDTITPQDLSRKPSPDGTAVAVDMDLSGKYRDQRLPGAHWGIRPRLGRLAAELPAGKTVVLYSEHETRARLAVADMRAATDAPIAVLAGGREAWVAAGLPTESSGGAPADSERIDFLFFVHDRHDGNEQAMRDYLSWEEQLPAQIDNDGDADFTVIAP